MQMCIHISIKLASHDWFIGQIPVHTAISLQRHGHEKISELAKIYVSGSQIFLYNILCHEVSQHTEYYSWEHYASWRCVHMRCGGWLLCEYYTSSVICVSKIYCKQTYLNFSFTCNNITFKISWQTWQNLWHTLWEPLIYVIC